MKNIIVGSENVWARNAPVFGRSWVRKGLGSNRLFLLGPKRLWSETSDIPNGDPTDGWTDGLTDVWLAGTFKQIHVIATRRVASMVTRICNLWPLFLQVDRLEIFRFKQNQALMHASDFGFYS